MKRRSKKYTEALSKIEKNKVYTKEEAIKLVKETSISSFDASVEVASSLFFDYYWWCSRTAFGFPEMRRGRL